jgi:hypothetical protein
MCNCCSEQLLLHYSSTVGLSAAVTVLQVLAVQMPSCTLSFKPLLTCSSSVAMIGNNVCCLSHLSIFTVIHALLLLVLLLLLQAAHEARSLASRPIQQLTAET